MQQDGPNTHIKPDDELFLMQLDAMGLKGKIKLVTQPPNSPDTNVNDLGFFRALQSLAWKKTAADVPQLINNVITSYQTYDPKKLNRIWLSLMGVLNQIIESNGNNDCKLPHMGKEKLERAGNLPVTIPVTDAANKHLA